MADKIPPACQSAAEIVRMMHQAGKDEQVQMAQIGKVLSPPPDIVVEVNNIQLTREDVLVSRYLMPNYTRHVKGETDYRGGGSGDPAYESHNHPVDNDETWTDTLKEGTLVLVIPLEGSAALEGNQLYWIADSGVRP